jgi:tetratricopeptide (TPR) repeat protein
VRPGSRVLLPLVALLAVAGTALAAREWYDYYLQAKEIDIPARKWADCVNDIGEALKLRPKSATNVRTYGMGLVDYLPYYYLGICLQGQQEHEKAIDAFNQEEQLGAIKKTTLHGDLIRRRGESQAAELTRMTRRARSEVQRLLQRAQELGRRGAWDESLPLLAQAEQLAKGLDADTLRSVTREQERQRAAQKETTDATAREQRLEQRLGDGERLLAEEATGRWPRDALELDPQNARALAGRHTADERIQASTTRAAREKSLADGKALFDAGQYEAALGPLTDACTDPTIGEACDLLARARQVLEGLRRQKELRAEIDRLAAEGEELMKAGRFPEAQVKFDSVLRLDSGHARAREGLAEAERRTGEAIVARWLPNQEPALALFEPEGPVLDSPTLLLQGVASDDRASRRSSSASGAG